MSVFTSGGVISEQSSILRMNVRAWRKTEVNLSVWTSVDIAKGSSVLEL